MRESNLEGEVEDEDDDEEKVVSPHSIQVQV